MLSEKLGSPVEVINSAHVRALYRVGPEQRERLLEAGVTKVDDDGQPLPLTGAELKLLVDRMLDPATPAAELNRLLLDPKAQPAAFGMICPHRQRTARTGCAKDFSPRRALWKSSRRASSRTTCAARWRRWSRCCRAWGRGVTQRPSGRTRGVRGRSEEGILK